MQNGRKEQFTFVPCGDNAYRGQMEDTDNPRPAGHGRKRSADKRDLSRGAAGSGVYLNGAGLLYVSNSGRNGGVGYGIYGEPLNLQQTYNNGCYFTELL